MPSDLLSEVPQYRGKTLSPESPRPIHLPEPSTIPVLAKQIDPIFNLMSTHMEAPHALRDLTEMDYELGRTDSANQAAYDANGQGDGDAMDYLSQSQINDRPSNGEDGNAFSLGEQAFAADNGQSDSSLNQIQTSLLADEPSNLLVSLNPSPTIAQIKNDSSCPILSSSKDSLQSVTEPSEPTQVPPVLKSQDAPNANDNVAREDMENEEGLDIRKAAGVNYENLLDHISPPSATIPSSANFPVLTTTSPTSPADIPATDANDGPTANTLPTPLGLPPRPPPQEKPAIHPNYVPGEDIRSYHYPHNNHANTHTNHANQASNSYRPSQSYQHSVVAAGAPGTSSAPNGLPPPPLATFQQLARNQEIAQSSPNAPQSQHRDLPARNTNGMGVSTDVRDDDTPWGPETQREYDQFLSDERVYTAEGTWDKFPQGSRLFVGNLPSEVVTKRDIFHIFHRYGKLAQISIKQAYGFVQYLDASACLAALQAEQGMRIKDRTMNLEVSKPPKNSRNAPSTAAGDSLRASYYRRSRSPNQGRPPSMRGTGPRPGADRFVPHNDFRDQPRRRDDYRPMRSPSPKGYRGRDEYRGGRDRSPDRYYGGRRSRSRSPYGRGAIRQRSPSPRRREIDEDAALPVPRRDARDVPDVQLILVEELDRAFVSYIEQSFRERSLRCAVLLMPRASLASVVKRQILEGVLAVVKLYRGAQNTGKIPLQLFDRSGGVDNVRFEEYDDLEARIAAELVVRAKAKSVGLQVSQNQYQIPTQVYGGPPYSQLPVQGLTQTQIPNAVSQQPNIANLITSLDGPALQKLLGAMQQSPKGAPNPQSTLLPQQLSQHTPRTQDLAALLGTVGRSQPPAQSVPGQTGYTYPQHLEQQTPQHYSYGSQYHGQQQMMPGQQQQQQQQEQQPSSGHQEQQHVQNIMEQLARWKR